MLEWLWNVYIFSVSITFVIMENKITTTDNTNITTTVTTAVIMKNKMFPSIAMRSFIAVTVVSAAVILYFIIRSICSRKRKTKRYGILKNNRADGIELHPLSEVDDDDDDDLTLFDLNQQRKSRQ